MDALIAVAGPTASGKSELALRISEVFDGEIVNCDSLQVYRSFDIGTAKLPAGERRGIPHHLIDILEPDEVFTAGEFARRARIVVKEIAARGRLPVLAGGTGFYLRALIDGLSPGPQRDQPLRERLAAREARRPGALHRLLRRFDGATAARIHPNDIPKTMRAVEICLLSRRPASEVLAQARDALTGFRVLKIGLFPPRAELYDRIELRTRRMFQQGLIEEVEGLLARDVSPQAKPFESLGYRQALAVVRGELSVDEAIADTALRTRQYAKRQMTWFRREPGLHMVNGFGDRQEDVEPVLAQVSRELAEREVYHPPINAD
jgi:tRNA dimethylallyltransferase